MAEIAPAGGGPNRLFIVLAIGLAALLVIGLIGLGGFFAIQTLFKPSPTRVALATATRALPTSTPAPTETTAPTTAPTPTLVLSSGGTETAVALGGAATATVTGTPAGTPEATGSGSLPQAGLGEDLLLLAGGVVLVMVVFVARRVRMT